VMGFAVLGFEVGKKVFGEEDGSDEGVVVGTSTSKLRC
jgi:hypothetical protein